jgi:hypothetical protein
VDASDLEVAKHPHLHLDFLEAGLHDVAQAHDARQPAGVEDGDMARPRVGHQGHHRVQVVVEVTGDDVAVHQLGDPHVHHAVRRRRQRARELALGEHAGEATVGIDDHERADVGSAHDRRRVHRSRLGLDRHDAAALRLGLQDRSHLHRGPPFG